MSERPEGTLAVVDQGTAGAGASGGSGAGASGASGGSGAGASCAGGDAQALIEEARRRHRRRQRWILTGLVVAALAAGLTYALRGGGASLTPGRAGHPGSTPSTPPQLRWKELAAAGLPRGSQVDSVVGYDGALYAAGSYFSGPGPVASGYPRGGLPIVWRSTSDGRHWTLAWQSGGIVLGSGGFAKLVATPHDLFLFEGDTAGTALWRSSDGTGFERQPLPPVMADLEVVGAVSGHGRLVAIQANKYAGGPVHAYGSADAAWSSVDGTSWRRGTLQGAPILRSLVVTPSGFVAGGESAATQTTTVWTSANGLAWTARGLADTGSVTVAGRGSTLVAFDAQGAALWRSRGASWARGVVAGPISGLPTIRSTVVGSMISAGPYGFLLAGRDLGTWWWSATGTRWVKLANPSAPGHGTRVTELFPDSTGLLAVGTHGGGTFRAVSFWQVTIEHRQ